MVGHILRPNIISILCPCEEQPDRHPKHDWQYLRVHRLDQGDLQIILDLFDNISGESALAFIGMLNCMSVFPVERDVFFREYLDGGFSVVAFFLTYFIFAIPFVLISASKYIVIYFSSCIDILGRY